MEKRGGFSITSNSIVIIILMTVILILGLSFIKGMFSKSTLSFEEKAIREPEPPVPTASEPIMLSREAVKTEPGGKEAIKISVYNPTGEDWIFRDYLQLDPDNPCTSDNICYQSPTCTDDADCNTDPAPTCAPDGECLITFDPLVCRVGADVDCAPTEGVRLSIECGLDIRAETNPKMVESGEYETFLALLTIKRETPPGKYLCKSTVIGEDIDEYSKDLTIEI